MCSIEGICISDDEGRLVRHQARNEVHVAAEPIELGRDDRCLVLAGGLERRGELGPTVQRIRTFAGWGGDADVYLDFEVGARVRVAGRPRVSPMMPEMCKR